MNPRCGLALVGVALLGRSVSLAAQATISGITISQAQPARGETATVTISGSGSLSGLSFYVMGYSLSGSTSRLEPVFGPVVLTSFPMVIPVTFPIPPSVELQVVDGSGRLLRRQSVAVVWPLVTDIHPPETGILTGKSATITIVGRGKPCPTLTVDFGDGTGVITLTNVALPLPVQHSFAKSGSFTISARTTQPSCTGQASRVVSVATPRLTGDIVPP